MGLLDRFRRKDEQPRSPLFAVVEAEMAGVRAYAQSHGGDIRLLDVDEDGVVTVKLRGACAMCPLSTVTLKLGVEKHLKAAVPGITKVISR